jgi:hypothetical protein
VMMKMAMKRGGGEDNGEYGFPFQRAVAMRAIVCLRYHAKRDLTIEN